MTKIFSKKKSSTSPLNERDRPKPSWWTRALSSPAPDTASSQGSISRDSTFTAASSVSTGPRGSRVWGDEEKDVLMGDGDGEEEEGFSGKLGNEIVKIYAGPSSHLIIVHHAILCAKIPLFVDVFAKWEGGADPYMMFPHDDATAFEVLIEWVYTGRLRPIHAVPSSPSQKLAWDPLALYLLASKFLLPVLQDKIMDIWVLQLSKRTPSPDQARLVYAQTPPDSPPRRLLAQCVAGIIVSQHRLKLEDVQAGWSIGDSTALIGDEPDLLNDVLAVLKTYPVDVDKGVFGVPGCYFHGHAEGACYKRKLLDTKTVSEAGSSRGHSSSFGSGKERVVASPRGWSVGKISGGL
ncbi:hypothetical protein GLAREA_12466 [Glarea lozoyensis ATCC 20868]|uniref:BTB domain-containing protein n=1 Tax=Glarea lozoyensis (strain ATCC 20868 / MF5171) TaxID=1116229 RepID=S3D1L8_GLAL2|nr:uncharacterized protein GLAREA_12466 [Glarea lozoyensis ATCC 20868]EPE31710.1 hypothetical protein GLAREA_12466 [Glarea lozoyensis ATCC 20868]